MKNVIKGSIVTHAITGEPAIFIGEWLNIWTNQTIWNVRIIATNLVASWAVGNV